ncbi:hypothetical protein WMY93_032655 [Mugilogobius chulae]|uniref:Uncharacterized protein n=1 Tax=Mugilogobius chulae TaxID=88201 RepID=A0AAW0MR90_9GOBI
MVVVAVALPLPRRFLSLSNGTGSKLGPVFSPAVVFVDVFSVPEVCRVCGGNVTADRPGSREISLCSICRCGQIYLRPAARAPNAQTKYGLSNGPGSKSIQIHRHRRSSRRHSLVFLEMWIR